MRPKKIILVLLYIICCSWIYNPYHNRRAGELEMAELVRPEEGGPDGIITFRLLNGAIAPSDINITYVVNATVTNPAINGVDYTSLSGSITLPAGDAEVQLVVAVTDDILIEGEENLEFTLLSATDQGGVSYLNPNRTLTTKVVDNDNRLAITKVTDGKELGGGNASDGIFNISLPGVLTFNEDILVKYTIDGVSTAIGGNDYSTANMTGEITLPANTNSIQLPLHVIDDQIVEGNETVQITLQDNNLSTVTGMKFTYAPASLTAIVNIEDDDDKVPVGVQSVADGKEPGGTGNEGNFVIGWPAGTYATGSIIIRYTLTGTATNGTDYNTIALTKAIPAGTSNVTIPVIIKDDILVEGDETVNLTITGITVVPGMPPLTTGTATGTVTIKDNDVMSSLQWKSASHTGTAVKAGDEIIYTIHVRNTGNVALSNVKISDMLPANTIFVRADEGIVPDGTGKLTWMIGSIAAGAADNTRSFTVRVANDLTGVTNITNTGDVDNGNGTGDHPTTPPDPNNPNEPQTNPNPLDPSTDIPVDDGGKKSVSWKTAAYTGSGQDGKVKPGDEIIYTVHVRNTGHVRLTNVTISDDIPAYTVFVSAQDGIAPVAGKLTWTVTDIPVGAADVTRSFTVRVTNDLTGAVSITNTAGVDNGDGSGEHPTSPPDPGNPANPHPNPDPNDPSTEVPVDNAKKSVSWKRAAYTGTGANGMVKPGDEITYTIHLRNTGNVALDNVSISDNIPSYTEFVSAEGGAIPDGSGKLSWIIPTVAVGAADVTRSFVVRVVNDLTDAGYITNTGYVDNGDGTGDHPTSPPDPGNPNEPQTNPDPNDPSTEIPVDNGKRSDNWKSAEYVATGPNGGVTTGDLITYTIHIRNTGSIKLVNVQVVDTIPAYTEFVSADEGVGPTADRLRWTIPEIAVGSADVVRSFTVRVVADLTGATAITNTAGVDNGNGKGNQPTTPSVPGDPGNPATNPPTGGPATEVPVDKVFNWETWKTVITASGADKVKPGEELTYTIHLRNTGNAAVENIKVIDTVPAHTAFVRVTENGTYEVASNAVTWIISQIPVGATADVSLIVKADDNLDSIPVIVNTAVTTDGTNTKPTAGCDPASPGCSGQPGTSIETTPGDGELIFANAMSPNGDGKNDYFIIKGLDKYPPASLFVFNRWGNMVYQSRAYNNDWDGTGLSEGTYYYKLEIEASGGIRKYTGWIVLKRK